MSDQNKNAKIGLTGAISIGIGGMVGGGIFAVLGLAVINIITNGDSDLHEADKI